MSNWKEFLTRKNVLALLGLFLMAVTLPLAAVLVKQRQETRKEAVGCPVSVPRSDVRFVNTAGDPITTARTGDKVRAEVNVGGVDAADIVLGFNNTKLEFDTTFGTNGIQKGSVGGLTHFGSSGAVDLAPGRTDVTRILFIVQRAHGATATGGKIATVGLKVKSTTPDDTTQVFYGDRTTLALNGDGGHAECGRPAPLTLNGTGPTNTPPPAGGPTATPTISPLCGNSVLDAGEVCDRARDCVTGVDGVVGCKLGCVDGYPNNGHTLWCKNDCSGYVDFNPVEGRKSCLVDCTIDPIATQTRWGAIHIYVGNDCPSGGFMNASCQCVASLPTNTPGPTATPTQPAVGGNFSLGNNGSAAVTGTFSTDVLFNSRGISTKNFQIAFHFDSAKIKILSAGPVDAAHLEADANNSGGANAHVLLRTKAGNAFTKIYGTAGGAAEKIGTITFQFQGINKQANVTFDAATSGSWINVTAAGVKTAATAPSYCYFMTGGACAAAPTPTPTGPTATPTQPAATSTPAPTATPTTPLPTPTFMSQERCRLTMVNPRNYAPGEQVAIRLTQNPGFPNNGHCYYSTMEVKLNGTAIIGMSGFSPAIRTMDSNWNTTGKTPGTYTLTTVYGGHSDNCATNSACCDNGYTCSVQVVLTAAVTPTVPACLRGAFGNLDCSADGVINMTDLSILLGSWSPNGPVPTPGAGRRSADIAGGTAASPSDGKVNMTDLSQLLQHWGTGQ